MMKGTSRSRTLKRICVLRELGTMGITVSRAAELTDVTIQTIYALLYKGGFKMPRGRCGPPPRIQSKILRDFGKEGMTPRVMAQRYGTSANSIRVRMCQMRKEGKLPPLHQSH